MAELRTRLRCRSDRCATVRPSDAEICDECGLAELISLANTAAALVVPDRGRLAAFLVSLDAPSVIGRQGQPGDPPPEIDLGRIAGSSHVHRSHARLSWSAAGWWLHQLGTNPVVLQHGSERRTLAQGESQPLHSGDWLAFGAIWACFLSAS